MSDQIQAITMPKWGMTMTEGKITAWLFAEGDAVGAGDEFVEVETDKIANVVEAEHAGHLRRILVPAGQSARCGSLIAVMAPQEVTDAAIDTYLEGFVIEGAGDDAQPSLTQRKVAVGDLTLNVVTAAGGDGVPVVMIHDDLVWSSGAIFRPAWYREFIFPNLKKYIDPLRQAGKKVMFTSDGDYTKFIDDIAAAGVNGFIMEPMTSLELLAERYGKTHVLIGNADTRILLSGTREQIRAEVERCMNVGRNCPGFFMAVGNHIPPNTPVENCLYYNEVYQELSRR